METLCLQFFISIDASFHFPLLTNVYRLLSLLLRCIMYILTDSLQTSFWYGPVQVTTYYVLLRNFCGLFWLSRCVPSLTWQFANVSMLTCTHVTSLACIFIVSNSTECCGCLVVWACIMLNGIFINVLKQSNLIICVDLVFQTWF